MNSFLRFSLCASFAFALLAACGSDPAPTPTPLCVPGASAACVGVGGCAGGQVCNAAGSGFGACECSAPIDAGPVDGSADDLGPADGGGVGACDPLTQTGCAPTERCAWVRTNSASSLGQVACVPNGSVADQGACAWGPDGLASGHDNCARGLVCVSGTCRAVCDPTVSGSCGIDVCMMYEGLFADATPPLGACEMGCDPVNQRRNDGASCGAGMGCYVALGRGDATCASVPPGAEALVHGDAPLGSPGSAYLNGCAPGYIPGVPVGGQQVCMALCRPAATSSSAPIGVAGSPPYSCPDRGAPWRPNECLYMSVFADWTLPYDPRTNQIGVCMNTVDWTFDIDGDPLTAPAPWPDCTTLPDTDTNGDGIAENLYWGCAPKPAP